MVRFAVDAADDGTLVDKSWLEIAANPEVHRESGLLPRYLQAPLVGVWEITGRCGLRCLYCYNESPRTPPDLEWPIAERVVRDIISMRLFAICISGGEPTLHPHYLDIVRSLAESGVAVGTITNGWTMTPELARRIARYTTTAQVSLDGPSAEVHDLVRGRRGSFVRAARAVRLLHDSGAQNVSVSFAGTRLNVDSFPRMPELCVELGADKLRTQPLSMVGRAGAAPDLEPTPEQARGLKDFIEAAQGKYGDLKIEWGDPSAHVKVGLGIGMALTLRITQDGNFGFSPYYPIFFGNARESRLSEVWERGLRAAWEHEAVRTLFDGGVDSPVLRTPPGLEEPLHLRCCQPNGGDPA